MPKHKRSTKGKTGGAAVDQRRESRRSGFGGDNKDRALSMRLKLASVQSPPLKEPQYALFGMFQIPAAVLVSEDGTVIAFGGEVPGDKLLGQPGARLREVAPIASAVG